nr:MAG TPA: hypothetical protein [Caudoviricetes sp.]
MAAFARLDKKNPPFRIQLPYRFRFYHWINH